VCVHRHMYPCTKFSLQSVTKGKVCNSSVCFV